MPPDPLLLAQADVFMCLELWSEHPDNEDQKRQLVGAFQRWKRLRRQSPSEPLNAFQDETKTKPGRRR